MGRSLWNSPFKGARRSTLIRGLAYHLQCKTYGGLKPGVSRELLKIAVGKSIEQAEQCSKPCTSIGSQLVREWNGKTYTVTVSDRGYVLNGVTYPLDTETKTLGNRFRYQIAGL